MFVCFLKMDSLKVLYSGQEMSMLLSGLFSQHAQGPGFHIESQYSFLINQVRHRSGALAYSCNLSTLKAEAEGLLLV